MRLLLTLLLSIMPAAPTPPPTPIQVQYVLRSFGYAVPVNGVIDARTKKAIKHFQKVSGLTVDGIAGPITWDAMNGSATRLTPPVPAGLNGLAFSPPGLSDCDEMSFYRQQAGLPDRFDAIGWRESNCKNEDSVRTFCCYGYWQNYISSHLSSGSAYRGGIINFCHVTSAEDINSDTALDKQRQACVTAIVYSISGYSPWAL